jgi:hypothetical protein
MRELKICLGSVLIRSHLLKYPLIFQEELNHSQVKVGQTGLLLEEASNHLRVATIGLASIQLNLLLAKDQLPNNHSHNSLSKIPTIC